MVEESEAVVTSCCASCGIAEIDDIELVPCDDCDLVKYCSDECREDHKSEHEEACKERAAELRDEVLFKQPESTHLGDCPICCLPLPLDISKSTMMACCSKVICDGCSYAYQNREREMRLRPSCPFCRKLTPENNEQIDKRKAERIEANDPVAIREWGSKHYVKGDYKSAFEYYTKAAELGDALAHHMLADMYHGEEGVEKDEAKKVHHAEEAAIGGHPDARYNLGVHEWNNNDNAERAVKHWIIAATLGDNGSITELIDVFKEGFVEKEILTATFRAHKAAVDATKSPERKAAEEYQQSIGGQTESTERRS